MMPKPRTEDDALSGFRQCVDELLDSYGYDTDQLLEMLEDLIEERAD